MIHEELDEIVRLEDLLSVWQQNAQLDYSVDPSAVSEIRRKLANVRKSVRFRIEYIETMSEDFQRVAEDINTSLISLKQQLRKLGDD